MTTSVETLPVKTSVGNYFVSNYPPYSVWSPDQIPKLVHALSKSPKAGPLSLYVHLPFCRQRCTYCYFRVYPRRTPADVDLYVETVLKEFSAYLKYPAVQNRSFSSVYIGGGSPSYLSSEQLRRLLGGLQAQSSWEAVEECTVECEPGTVTPEKLETLKALGVTRLSLGFQSLDDEILRRCGRDLLAGDCLRAFHQARAAGFGEINIDLLCGLEGETRTTWRRTVDQALELMPDSVTLYQFELPFNSGLYSSMKSGRAVTLPGWTTKREWVEEGFRMCEEAGFVVCSGYTAIRHPQWWRFVYTVDHFWHGVDLVGLGESAFGHIQGVHYQNADTFERYVGLTAEGKLPLRRALKLTPEERLRREVILLLKTGCLDGNYFRTKFGVELLDHFEAQFEELLQAGFLEVERDNLRLTREGLLRVDWFLPKFYQPEHVGLRYT